MKEKIETFIKNADKKNWIKSYKISDGRIDIKGHLLLRSADYELWKDLKFGTIDGDFVLVGKCERTDEPERMPLADYFKDFDPKNFKLDIAKDCTGLPILAKQIDIEGCIMENLTILPTNYMVFLHD